MELAGPSRTALATAYARAYHQVANEPRVFTDLLAGRILGVTDAELTALHTAGPDHPGHAGASHRPRRLFIAARARFAEDAVRDAVATGVRQAVILGAGLDTFACRNPYPDLRVFEVDHPDTQNWKRERLATAGITAPDTLTFAPVDFETETLATGLAAAGFDRTAPAIFVWLGVVVYLTPTAIDTTLAYIAAQATPTDLVFDYGTPPATPADHTALRARAARVAALGEPWLTSFTPADIATKLRHFGFTHIDDHPAQNLITTYTSLLDVTFPGPHLIRARR
ncbi:class I SAM-dependent methyltransferase [Nocardia sp. SSK8]|uniref:class I SAM-dependent methyltransferase n=1 Tax=Nocardia sp. SSK8 TaxID=3120154 RepID=UPI00300BA16C